MVYNAADQLLMWPGMHGRWNGAQLIPGYVYDSAGNLSSMTDVSGSNAVATYTYRPTGLLNVATFKDKTGTTRTLTNTCDADSNRVSFTTAAGDRDFVYDPTAG